MKIDKFRWCEWENQ